MAVTPALRFRQFADIKDPEQQQRHKGATFHWNVYSRLTAASGSTSRTLVETATMPKGSFTIAQGTLTIGEQGIEAPYTGLLDDLSEQPIKEIIHKVLKDDCKIALDSVAGAEFNKTPLRVCAYGASTAGTDTAAVTLTTNSVCTLTNSVALGKGHVKSIVDLMKERNIPKQHWGLAA